MEPTSWYGRHNGMPTSVCLSWLVKTSRNRCKHLHYVFPVKQNLGLSETESKRVDSIIHALKRYVDGHVNETVERRNFHKRMQQVGELFDDFLVSLRELVKTCNFCSDDCINKTIRDQIIEGLLDTNTAEDFLEKIR